MMQSSSQRLFLRNPTFQVSATWLWNLLGTFVVAIGIAIFLPHNIALDRSAFQQQPSLALIPILSESVLVGLLPILFSILCKHQPADYGITTKRLSASLILAAGIALVYFAYLSLLARHLTTGIQWPAFQHISLGYAIFAIVGLFAYGPLEVFFVIWLIHNTDRIFKSEAKTWSWGLLLTIALYALLHAFSQGANSLVIAAEMLAFGLVFKRTHNSIGPMLAFMLMNEYAWFLATVLLQ
ncbi:MAG: hypothetical protein U0175_29645 [Caldilineaceae bacterium]